METRRDPGNQENYKEDAARREQKKLANVCTEMKQTSEKKEEN